MRRFFGSDMPDVPAYRLIICPHWMRRLGWRTHQDNWLVYLDQSGAVAARIVWWRDGGPVDVDEDVVWGECFYVSVTSSGLSQIEAVTGRLPILVHALRRVTALRKDEESFSQTSFGQY